MHIRRYLTGEESREPDRSRCIEEVVYEQPCCIIGEALLHLHVLRLQGKRLVWECVHPGSKYLSGNREFGMVGVVYEQPRCLTREGLLHLDVLSLQGKISV